MKASFILLLLFALPLSAAPRDPDSWTEAEKQQVTDQFIQDFFYAKKRRPDIGRWIIPRDMILDGVINFSGIVIGLRQIVDNRIYNPEGDLYVHLIDNLYDFLDGISEYTWITHLYLDRLALTEIPPAIHNMKGLHTLSLQWNQIDELKFLRLPTVKVLKLKGNKIKEIPQKFGYFYLYKCESLDLSHNFLEEFDFDIFEPVSENLSIVIRDLDLSYNQLTEFRIGPEQQSIKILNLSHNKISVLKMWPEKEKSPKFKCFDISYNPLVAYQRIFDRIASQVYYGDAGYGDKGIKIKAE